MQQQDEKEESVEISKDQLNAIYIYLAMNYDEMLIDEKLYWNTILEKIDPEYGNED